MTTFFPVLAAILAALALIVSAPKPRAAASIPAYGAGLLLFIVASAVSFKFRVGAEAMAVTEGYGLGLLGAFAGSALSMRAGSKVGACVAALACGLMAASAVHLLHSSKPVLVQLSLLVGCGLTALILDLAEGSFASLASLAAAAVVCADMLGLVSIKVNPPGYAGTLMGIAAAGVGLIAIATERYGNGWVKKAVPVLLVALFASAGLLISKRWPDLHQAALVFPVACVAAIAVHWMMPPDEESNTLRLGLATIIWCALATFGFGYLKSFGAALCFTGACCSLLILGNLRALTSLVPLAMLTLYRVFRTSNTDTYQAIDIGQNYALIGFIVGAVAATLPVEWMRSLAKPEGRRAIAGMAVWGLYGMAIPALVLLLLSQRGTIGFLVGLGLAPLLAGWKGKGSLSIISISVGLGGLTVLSYGWLTDFVDLGRDDKMRDFGYMAAALIVGGIVLAWLGKSKSAEAAN